jgi:Flp pilus assembly protein TadD
MNYAQALYEKGQYEESLVQLREAARITPHADIYNNLGSVLVELGRFEEARAEFEHALSLNPSDREIAANLARLDALMQR